ncbi:hypothetical protein [Nitrincola alkalilacustris]|uniref:hypothetical protein n=1 Tax=Nitrincola alkalilacustris TaxID=1571224 RepID=UPI00124DE6B4|nr:hypothetical protein [Nitrincola alkalilacustris]
MKVMMQQTVEVTSHVLCDVCGRNTSDGKTSEFGTLKADWGYSSAHDGASYEVHLCEVCFFSALATLKEQRRAHTLFSDDNLDSAIEFGRVIAE